MINCIHCAGGGVVITSEWDREWDRFDQNSPSHWDTNKHMERSGIEKHEPCPICAGSGKLNELSFNVMEGLMVKSVESIPGIIADLDSIRIKFEDGSFLNIPMRQKENARYLKV